jgi:hypothetical protein
MHLVVKQLQLLARNARLERSMLKTTMVMMMVMTTMDAMMKSMDMDNTTMNSINKIPQPCKRIQKIRILQL